MRKKFVALQKVRQDITKLKTIKTALLVDDIFCECYFVMEKTPTDSMRLSGNAQKVKVLSATEFQNEFFDYDSYIFTRSKRQFGSLINIETGQPENTKYIPVSYLSQKDRAEYKISDIIDALKKEKESY